MTLRGVLAPVRANVLDAWSVQLASPQDLGNVIAAATSISAGTLRWVLAVLVLAATMGYAWRKHRNRLR